VKTSAIDFVLSAVALGLAVGLSIFAIVLLRSFGTPQLLGTGQVALDVLAFLFMFGLSCGFGCQLMARLGFLPAGQYDMNSRVFTAWKLFNVLFEFGRGALLPFTTVIARPLVARLFGTRLGKDVALAGRLFDPQLIRLGNEVIVGHGSVLTAHTIISGRITLSPIEVGDGATIGVNAVVMAGANIGAGSIVTPCSVVQPNTRIPPGELWGGAPAERIKSLRPSTLGGDVVPGTRNGG